jgi:hypothetical protein
MQDLRYLSYLRQPRSCRIVDDRKSLRENNNCRILTVNGQSHVEQSETTMQSKHAVAAALVVAPERHAQLAKPHAHIAQQFPCSVLIRLPSILQGHLDFILGQLIVSESMKRRERAK